MRVVWKGTCAQCGEELAVKPRLGPERPPTSMMGGVKCDSCHGPTPIVYNRLRITVYG